MTHGTQKSDSRIVPAKRANKAAQAAAEPVEGRRGTVGNTEAQSKIRTQSRDVVSQARGRIRAAITRNKTEKLTALMHHITADALRHAFFTLKKRAAAGVDAQTWGDYAADMETVKGTRKSGHVAFEECTRRRPKSVPQGVIVGAWKGPPRGPFPCAAAI